MARDEIFNPEALNKLRSPDRLDETLKVMTISEMLILGAVGIMLVSVLAWSILGSFTESVNGRGFLMDFGGVETIVNNSGSGKLSKLLVTKGQRVHNGTIVAQILDYNTMADILVEKNNENLVSSEQELYARWYQQSGMAFKQADKENVFAYSDGIVDEILVQEGETVAPGTPICTIRKTFGRSELTGIMYVPLQNAKRIEPGMTVQLQPNVADAKQSGNVLGIVDSVSQYPVSPQRASMRLGNTALANDMMHAGSVMEVNFTVLKNPDDPSGFLWTSTVGKHAKLTPGTYCEGSIIVERIPPIEKIFYKFGQWLRNR